MFAIDARQLRDELVAACTTLSQTNAPEDERINASRRIRHLLMGLPLLDDSDWDRECLKEALSQADESVKILIQHQDIVEKEAVKFHAPGTTADFLISLNQGRVFNMRQYCELFENPQ